MDEIKITKEFEDAYKMMNAGLRHIFLTGQAGTGKSTLLHYFRENTQRRFVVLAPTGVAALNVNGQTIHSFFGFNPQIKPELVKRAPAERIKLFKNLEVLVIDEISMVRADLLDCVDKALRLNRKSKEPFGGVKMIFIGDLYQLPPIVTRDEQDYFRNHYESPYFFSAEVMRHLDFQLIELKKVHRQQDEDFVKLLNKVRDGLINEEDVLKWNDLHDPYFDPQASECVHLTTTNKMAEERNKIELKKLSGKEKKLKAVSEGSVGERRLPSDAQLSLKVGARIMFTTNDSNKRWVNGTLGTIVEISKDKVPVLIVQLDDGKEVEVKRHTWEICHYVTDIDGNFEQEVVGTYTQYPITLAWAVTIHKAQGKTFDKVLVDMGWGAFAHGQMYVALSRATQFHGITLLKPFRKKDVIIDSVVVDFMRSYT